MPALWTYPWDLAAEGLDDAVAAAAARGIDTLVPAVHYHSVQSMRPRVPESLFASQPGGCYFEPDPSRYEATPIAPIPNEVPGLDDPLDAVAAAAGDHGIDVAAWTVLGHNSRLGATHSEYCVQDAFGGVHEHAFCPSNEAVRSYYAALVADVASHPVDAVELESVGFPSVLHGHDTTFGHAKRQVLTSPTEEWLVSQCFCEACRDRARDGGVDVDRARAVVRGTLRESFRTPHADPPALAALLREHPSLARLFEVRRAVVADLLDRLGDAADVPVDAYLMDGFGTTPGDGWPAGVRLADVEAACDRATAICYVDDPATVRDRLRRFDRRLDVPVDAGVTLDPDVVGTEAAFRAVVDAARDAATGDVAVYHHTLATAAQLDWVARAFE